jgi:hypothetical protein
MSKIEIEIYNPIKNRNKNLLSVSIFKMKGPYRSFDKYLNYLKKLIDTYHVQIKNSNFDMRIYFDYSCKNEIKQLIEKYKQIEFYEYNYKPLRIGEFHNGTFGSIIRLLPIFDKNDTMYEYIWINDIDVLELDFSLLKDFKINNQKFNTIIYTFFCYNRPWTNSNYSLSFPLITNIKLDMNILLNFLNDLVNNKYKNVIDKILLYRNDRYKYDNNIKFPYGMDEYFINNIIYNDLTKNKAYINYNYEITRLLRKIKFLNIIKDNRNNEIIDELLKLENILWITNDLKIKNQIINTYIKLVNKIGLQNMKHYFSLINEESCIDGFFEYIKNVNLQTINNFYKIIPIKN